MYERLKPALRGIAAVLAMSAIGWALAIWLLGGFKLSVAGRLIASTDPLRPLLLAVVAVIAYLGISGPSMALRDFGRWRSRVGATPVAFLLALCPAAAGLARNSWTAGGADSYAYVTQADLWLHFRLKIPVPIASLVPWPSGLWTFAPYGYRPAADAAALVPVTAPGLPLMMAAAKFLAGHCAMFWVVPLTGALLVWVTFATGRKLGSSGIGLAAAWLVATSPAFLAMLVSPMSDVPAAAFWALAIFYALSDSRGAAVAAGAAAAVAILIRPNLAPLAIILVGWKLVCAIRDRERPTPALLMCAGILPGPLIVAIVNAWLYGSPISSGYGAFLTLFSIANVGTNLHRYGGWLIETQTSLAAIGIAVLLIPSRALWPDRQWQRAAWLMASVVATVWALYCAYTPFDAWWYLRFLLPSWPAMSLGAATLAARLMEHRHNMARAVVLPILIGVGLHGLYFAARQGAYPVGEGDHRYVSIAKLVEQYTDPRAVILTGQHTGPTRYYAGRATLRFDLLDEGWLDGAVQWLGEHDRHPYLLVEDWELAAFRQRFAAKNRLGALALAPILAYQATNVPGVVYLFDPAQPDGPTRRPPAPPSARDTCVEPAPPADLEP
jgi:hypothetical protein